MNVDHLSRPLLGALAIAGILAFAGEAAAPEAEIPPLPPPGAALLADLDALHQRLKVHSAYYAGRESWLDVGVYPVPGRAQR